MKTDSTATQTFSVQGNENEAIEFDLNELRSAQLTFVALNHDLRRQILSLLDSEEDLTVTDLYVRLRLEQSIVSQHLGKLRRAGIVTANRRGRNVLYQVNKERMHYLAEVVRHLAM